MTVAAQQIDLLQRIETALDTMRPFMMADGGNVELIGVDDSMIAKVRLVGSCRSCDMSHMTMKAGVEEAVLKSVPELKGITAIDE
ncbi:MAG: Fe-S cluster biogenesis protein NfuA [Bacteroidia bacterium]|jgi:Fe-S cluster biogenesis protein NfuA